MPNELKPCPFCGGKAEAWVEFIHHESYGQDEVTMHHCGCKKCNIYSNWPWWREGAIIAWNRRIGDS